MLPLFPIAVAAAASGWSGAHLGDEVVVPRKASVAAGIGGSWIFGPNASGYDGGVAERVVADVALGHATAFTVEFDHARQALRDAGAYFPDVPVPAGAITGFRDYMIVDAGFRIGVELSDPTRAPVGSVRVLPYARLGVGIAMTNTLLDAPGLDGRVAMRSRTAWPAPSASLGAEVRIRRWISVLPNIKTQVQVFEDGAESVGGETRVAAEWRVQPALDVSINF